MEEEKKTMEQPQIVTVKLNKYKTFVDALGNPKTAYRVVFTLFLLGILLFAGITAVTLAVKRLYPYSDITTNALGATTIKSEKNEVSYWLFNTAILWADSGIKVDKGDILTIRASGKSNTAIHHLYDAASDNTVRIDEWVGSEGESDRREDIFNYERRRFRVFPNMNSGALLMQVSSKGKIYDTPLDKNAEEDNFYFIGKERQHIYINESGTLHFAVNDIVLTRNTLSMMMSDVILNQNIPNGGKDERIKWIVDNADFRKMNDSEKREKINDTAFQDKINDIFSALVNEGKLNNPENPRNIGNMNLGRTQLEKTDLKIVGEVCELTYYYGLGKDAVELNKKCKTCWYDDNVGSFLIIVEKTRSAL